ncbi:MAG: DUF1800 domain-containing protein [Phycisphaerae bacterium]
MGINKTVQRIHHADPAASPESTGLPQSDKSVDTARRKLLSWGTLGALGASALGNKPETVSAGGVPEEFDQDLILLIDRITGGFSLAEYNYAASLGYDAYLAEQLAYEGLIGDNDPALQLRLTAYDIQPMTAEEIRNTYNPDNMSNLALFQTTTIQVMWSVYARAQLYYRMHMFWNHHFSIDMNSSTTQRFILWPFLRDAINAYAMENVPELVRATAYGPAMLLYLNNNTNIAQAPNENYARELMELHTLGADNGYDQEDIEALARILTGWSACFNGNGCSGGQYAYGQFRFIPGNHDQDDKFFLGQTITGLSGDGAVAEGEEAIEILTNHQNTADYIARKMCRFFLGGTDYNYNPPEDIVQAVKWTYLTSNPVGDIRAMLNVILARDVLTTHAVPKFRRPADLTSAALRALGAEITATSPGFLGDLRFHMQNMGMHPNFWGPPDGPYDSQAWSESNMIPRWLFVDDLARNGVNEAATISISGLLQGIGYAAAGTQAQGLNIILTGGRMTDKEVDAVQDFIGLGVPSETTLREATGLAMSLPTFQFI